MITRTMSQIHCMENMFCSTYKSNIGFYGETNENHGAKAIGKYVLCLPASEKVFG